MSRPSKIPEWATTGSILEPSAGKKASGHLAGEEPAAEHENWRENLIGQWVEHLALDPIEFSVAGVGYMQDTGPALDLGTLGGTFGWAILTGGTEASLLIDLTPMLPVGTKITQLEVEKYGNGVLEVGHQLLKLSSTDVLTTPVDDIDHVPVAGVSFRSAAINVTRAEDDRIYLALTGTGSGNVGYRRVKLSRGL